MKNSAGFILETVMRMSFGHGKLGSVGGGLASKPILTFMLTTVHVGSISPLTILLLPHVISTIT
jgi:hypothetical protein